MQYLSKSAIRNTSNKSNLFVKGVSFICMSLFVSTIYILPTKTANAGLFSTISNFISDKKVSAETIESPISMNSQNMPLLQAAVNIDPNPHKSDDGILLAYDNALVAEVGPQGTVSEAESKISTEISIYTVREGDTISHIAQMFNVSVNTIIWANELGKNPIIREGQTLVILPITGVRYTVKSGDTIKGIVLRHKANLEEVLQYNDLTLNSLIKVGDIIVIPDAEPTVTSSSKISSSRSTSGLHDANGPFYPGYYIRPIEGGKKSQGLHGYNAVDLAAPAGTVIRASAGGKVISSISNGGWNGGYGNYVIISHDNGTQTLYAHNQKNFVSIGDTVEQGQMIAKVGNTGKSTGAHVHFEIRGAKNPF